MGGIGSGQYFRWRRRKTTVEESLVIAVKDVHRRFVRPEMGTLLWGYGRSAVRRQAAVDYLLSGGGDERKLILRYCLKTAETVWLTVRLQTTPTQFGGRRWWFTCPLVVNGVPCERRVGKLYLPPGAKCFGCRTCHNLTYRSCQEAHQEERLLNSLEKMEVY